MKKLHVHASRWLHNNLKYSLGPNQLSSAIALSTCCRYSKGVATRSENSNEIVSVTSYLRKTIVTIALVNDFVQDGRVELYRLVALYCCILIG